MKLHPTRTLSGLVCLAICLHAAASLISVRGVYAQSIRSSFPGRRVGGGTRGECASRVVAHLVPPDSIYSPGGERLSLVGIIQAPSKSPSPLDISFRKLSSSGSASSTAPNISKIKLPPANASVVLLSIPRIESPLIWESSYDCVQNDAAGEFGFVSAGSPPAVSMLTVHPSALDLSIRSALIKLRQSCGQDASVTDLLRELSLDDQLSSLIPDVLPVLCPSVPK